MWVGLVSLKAPLGHTQMLQLGHLTRSRESIRYDHVRLLQSVLVIVAKPSWEKLGTGVYDTFPTGLGPVHQPRTLVILTERDPG